MTDLEQVTALADSYHLPLVFGEIKASSGSFLFLDYVLEKLSVLQSVCPSFVQRKSSESFNHTWNGDAKIRCEKKKGLLSSRSRSQVERLYNQNVIILAVSSEPIIHL